MIGTKGLNTDLDDFQPCALARSDDMYLVAVVGT